MKDRKIIPLDHEQQDDDFFNTIKQIETGLSSIDNNMPINTPNLEWFEQMVSDQKEQLRKRLVRDVTIFLVISLFIVSGVLFTLSQLPVVFFILQGIVTLFIAGYSAFNFIKQVNQS